jgi:hypothetical protein
MVEYPTPIDAATTLVLVVPRGPLQVLHQKIKRPSMLEASKNMFVRLVWKRSDDLGERAENLVKTIHIVDGGHYESTKERALEKALKVSWHLRGD